MKFLLISRIDEKKALEYTVSLGKTLADFGHETVLERETATAVGSAGVPIAGVSADLAVVIGGDGTILQAVQQMTRPIPIVGINCGDVGFLADLDPRNAPGFLSRLEKGFSVEKRMRIALSLDGEPIGSALNEALIVTGRPAKMLRFVVMIDGTAVERFRADGLLISTPTGSTAYAMSAGGPIVDPRIEGILLVPLAPYLLSSRPHLISSDRSIEIRLESAKPATLVIDGQMSLEIGTEGAIAVAKAALPALFLDAGKSFFGKIGEKLKHL